MDVATAPAVRISPAPRGGDRALLPREHGSWSLALMFVMLSRSVPAVMSVRAYLRRSKGADGSSVPSLLTAVIALVPVIYFARAGDAPAGAVVFGVLWVARSAWLLSSWAPRWTAKTLGLCEAVLGAAAVLVAGLTWPG